MPEFKERPKIDKPNTKLATIPPKLAARILSEKYRQQLDQRPEGIEDESADATDKIKCAGWGIASEAINHGPRPSYRQGTIQRKGRPAPPEERSTFEDRRATPKTRPEISLKTKDAQEQTKIRQPPPSTPRQRAAPTVTTPRKEVSPSDNLIYPREAGRQAFVSQQRGKLLSSQEPFSLPQGSAVPMDYLQEISSPNIPQEAVQKTFSFRQRSQHRELLSVLRGRAAAGSPKRSSALKERPHTIFKDRSGAPSSAPKIKPDAKAATKAVKQSAQQHMRQRMIEKAQQAAKITVDLGPKFAVAVAKTTTFLVDSLGKMMGGSIFLILPIFIIAIAAIVSSPFGLFFAGEQPDPGAMTPGEAVAQINAEYADRIETLMAGSYDGIEMSGQPADWRVILAVFAVKTAGADDGVDVATLVADRVARLREVYWDMTTITTWVETIDHDDSNPEDEVDDSWTEYILHITVTPKTAEDMKAAYSFTDYQNSALHELLSDQAALSSLAGSLAITNTQVRAILDDLPLDLPADRRKVAETALQLVGKVNYFWGGKSYGIGWDSRWGQLMKVTAGGDSTTGTYRPYGLDCTGFIDWTFRNAGLPSDGHWYIGTNLTEVSWSEALPGDLALYPDVSHIGMVVGRDSAGKLLICHCSSGANNVVISDCIVSGFTSIGRPAIYEP